MKINVTITLLLCVVESFQISAQTDSGAINKDEAIPILKLNGYIKDLNIFTVPIAPIKFQYTQLVHNRINMKLAANKVSAALEIRNRFFWGDAPRGKSSFLKQLKNQHEWMDLSHAWLSKNNAVMHSNIERFWMEYREEKWSVKAGRQRINWGMNNSWNPNDIFNSYNMFDFDYEERAGVDGIRFQYQPKEFTGLELALRLGRKPNETTTAIKYNFNHQSYDWQMLAGIYNNNITAGIGWQGSIGEMGFKGETQAFKRKFHPGYLINSSIEMDYILKNGWYLFTAILYNGQGITKPLRDWSGLSFENNPENLMPTRWNLIGGCTKEIKTLFTGRISIVYAPFANLMITIPSLTYGIATNVDVDFFAQSYLAQTEGKFKAISHSIFIRGKWSF